MPVKRTGIQRERIKRLNGRSAGRGKYVVYWMQASQRCEFNHALEYSISEANRLGLPLTVYFGITDDYLDASQRHYRFILEGLLEAGQSLAERGIPLVVRHEPPDSGIVSFARQAAMVVTDRGYLNVQRAWRRYAAESLECPLIQVESDAVVPVEVASNKEEYSAATLRPRIHRNLPDFLLLPEPQEPRIKMATADFDSLDIKDIDAVLGRIKHGQMAMPELNLRGGTSNARKNLEVFLDKLDLYPEGRNDPNASCQSDMSPYLHFGQISPIYIALKVLELRSRGTDAYLEELIVRRELSLNYCYYNPAYDSFEGLPAWAQKTLREQSGDKREYTYSLWDLENARTHDPYWNAAQTEMIKTGKMHGYMRMYWGKKLLEWCLTPEEAFINALYLNNRYELDGRDPNGYAGVAWCFGKHDRPWRRRPVFGTVRYMNDKGLQRKFDADR
jgi:deoxyribodipyrimidine photo-lyase